MSGEAERINNPDSTPGAVATGYQLQNSALVSQRVGIDLSEVEPGVGTCTLKISGPIDVNGVMYDIKTPVVFTPTAGRWFIYLSGSGANLTPSLGSSSGTFDSTKNARYDVSGYRVLNWIIGCDGTNVGVTKLLTPDFDDASGSEAQNYLPDLDVPEEVYITGNGTWTPKVSKFYKIVMTGRGGDGGGGAGGNGTGGGGSGLTGIKRIYIEAGTTWTATFSSSSGGLISFSDGSTTLQVQNGYSGTSAPANGGIGGTSSEGQDISFNGNKGHTPHSTVNSGEGAGGFYGEGGTSPQYTSSNGLVGSTYGCGGSGGGGNSGTVGGAGGSALIRIIG